MAHEGNFVGCENSQPAKFLQVASQVAKFSQVVKFWQVAKILQSCSISSALLSASLFFWFLICRYELNLDSPWLS